MHDVAFEGGKRIGDLDEDDERLVERQQAALVHLVGERPLSQRHDKHPRVDRLGGVDDRHYVGHVAQLLEKQLALGPRGLGHELGRGQLSVIGHRTEHLAEPAPAETLGQGPHLTPLDLHAIDCKE
jgi:hypothetical protein